MQYTLEISAKSNICDFEGILKSECNLQHLTSNCRIKDLDDFERDKADAWSINMKNRTFKSEGGRNDHMPHYEQVFGNVLREEQVNVMQY